MRGKNVVLVINTILVLKEKMAKYYLTYTNYGKPACSIWWKSFY